MARTASKVAHYVAQLNTKGFGDSEEHIYGDRPVRPLDLANVNRVQIGLFR